MANSVDPDQTGPIGAICSGSTLFAPVPYFSVMLGNNLQQMTSADDIFRFFLSFGALRVNILNVPYLLKRLEIKGRYIIRLIRHMFPSYNSLFDSNCKMISFKM